MAQLKKFNYQPQIDTSWDSRYRFDFRWDAKDALENRTRRLCHELTKLFNMDYSKSASRLAAEDYAKQLNSFGYNVNERELRDEFASRLVKYYVDVSLNISLENLRKESEINEFNGLFNYELSERLIEKYKQIYFKNLTGFYDEVYNYVREKF